MIDSNGFVSLEWQQWLQNPQFLSLSVNGQQLPAQGGSGAGSGAQATSMMFEEAGDGEPGIPGPQGPAGTATLLRTLAFMGG